MDRVAFDFRARVAALWKCCDSGYHYDGCVDKRVPDCDWTMKSKKQRIDFVIGYDRGEWSYRFTILDRTEEAEELLSMDELKKNPNLKDVRIQRIQVTNNAESSFNSLRSLEEIERLMKFVVFLSNEPQLELSTFNVHMLHSPEGATLLNSLSKMTFSRIWASYGFPVYNEIVENQFSRRKPTDMSLNCFAGNKEFFVEHLGNGNIKKFFGPSDFRFPAELMERIINRFLENPGNYDKNQFRINAQFEKSTRKMLKKKLKEGRCETVVRTYFAEYRFKANNPKLEDPCMWITFLFSGTIISVE